MTQRKANTACPLNFRFLFTADVIRNHVLEKMNIFTKGDEFDI